MKVRIVRGRRCALNRARRMMGDLSLRSVSVRRVAPGLYRLKGEKW